VAARQTERQIYEQTDRHTSRQKDKTSVQMDGRKDKLTNNVMTIPPFLLGKCISSSVDI